MSFRAIARNLLLHARLQQKAFEDNTFENTYKYSNCLLFNHPQLFAHFGKSGYGLIQMMHIMCG